MKRALVISIAIGAIFIPLLMAQAHASWEVAPFRDIGAIAVLVQPLGDDGRKAGITKEELKAFVELKLRQAGIPVTSIKEHVWKRSLEAPHLDVLVTLIYLERRDEFVLSVKIELKQSVRLPRNDNFVMAATWDKHIVGIAPRNKARNEVKDSIDTLLTFFINSYLEANPG